MDHRDLIHLLASGMPLLFYLRQTWYKHLIFYSFVKTFFTYMYVDNVAGPIYSRSLGKVCNYYTLGYLCITA